MTYDEGYGRTESMLDNIYCDEDTLRGALDALVDKAHAMGLTEPEIVLMLAKAIN